MLNIGRLAPGAADYYLGEVATSAEDYYTGRGESTGRWVGSLAIELGLDGPVEPESLRAVLEGRDPRTGAQLAVRPGRGDHVRLPHRDQRRLFGDELLDVPRVAARLGVSTRQVRRLLDAGAAAIQSPDIRQDGRLLLGALVPREGNQRGWSQWAVPVAEVERFEARHGSRKARPGYDLTLRPPKSVSILWALGSDEQRAAIRDAHREAVDEVVAYIERHALHARVTVPGKGRGRTETDGLVAAAFDHRTSRAGDPLLHTHVVTANLTRTPNGDWRALDARALYDQARPAGFLYQAHLRHLLTRRLGIHFSSVRNGLADVDGVPRDVILAFSKRRDEIEELVAESGYTSARAHQAATLASRQAKEYGVDPLTLLERWHDEAAALGFGAEQVSACFDRGHDAPRADTDALFTSLAGADGLTEQASTFGRGDVIEAIASRLEAATATRIERLADEFLASDLVSPLVADASNQWELVWRRDGSRTRSADLARFSTPELLAAEAGLLTWAHRGFGAPVPEAPSRVVDAVLDRWPGLSAEQGAMVRTLCGPGGLAIQPVAGRPGAGKTHATAAAVEAMINAGVPVVGCSVSATAAAELEASVGLRELSGRPATTMARLFVDLSRVELAPGTVVVVDEASMVPTRDLHRLARHTAAVGGRLWLIGDPDQHGPVDAGGMFRRLVEDMGERVPRLVENRRQIDAQDRAAISEYRLELIESALARYDAAGRLHRAPSAVASYKVMVDDWYQGVASGGRDPMIAGQHRVRRALNRVARGRLASEGLLSGEPLVTPSSEFAVGDWVVARRNAYHLKSPEGFVKNGSAGVITSLDHTARTMTVRFDRDGTIALPARYVDAGWVEHGYARTTYGVQGATLERALYHVGDASGFEEGYVALTRGRAETHLYLVDGVLRGEDDEDHEGHDVPATGLGTVTQSLERRRSRRLALDDDRLAAAVARFDGWGLDRLHRERRRLESVLADQPGSVERRIAAVTARRENLLARARALSAGPRSRVARELSEATEAAVRELADLAGQQAVREKWLEANAAEVEELQLVRRAEAARELQTRVGAALPPTLAGLGMEQSARTVAEMVAVHQGRFPAALIDNSDAIGVTGILGALPDDAEARLSYRLIEAALGRAGLTAEDFAHDTSESVVSSVEVD